MICFHFQQKKKQKKHRKKKPTSSYDNDTDTAMNGFDRSYSGTNNNAFHETTSDNGKPKNDRSDPDSVTIGSVLNKYGVTY